MTLKAMRLKFSNFEREPGVFIPSLLTFCIPTQIKWRSEDKICDLFVIIW